MSYCVNCGVELEAHLPRCPLCNTPVLNPNSPDFTKANSPHPYSSKKGQVDTVKRTDLAVLISVILVGTAFACGMLNLLVYQQNHWSFYVIGGCILLWILFTPMLIYRKMSPYITILLDAVAVTLYVGIVAYEFPKADWYFELVIPLMALITVMIEIFAFVQLKITRSIMVRATVVFSELAVFFPVLELLIRNHQERRLYITWSSILLTCCAVILAALLTIIARSRLREELRRRMHS